MKVWITKYALTAGIEEREGTTSSSCPTMFIAEPRKGEVQCGCYYHKPYWHLTKEEAICHAESLRMKKIDSLTKQIKKLQKLDFKKG